MFIPEPFQAKDDTLTIVSRLIANFPFATLISSRNSDIFISKVPIVSSGGRIYGHLSARNEHCSYLLDASCSHRLLIDGPHGFVSPRYLGNRGHDIPTWNYVSAVVQGAITGITDKKGICQILTRQLQAYDKQDVSYLDSSEFDIIEKEVMGFSFLLNESDVKIKLKLSQNKSAEDFNLIVEGLERNGENTLAEWMLGNFDGNQIPKKEN